MGPIKTVVNKYGSGRHPGARLGTAEKSFPSSPNVIKTVANTSRLSQTCSHGGHPKSGSGIKTPSKGTS